MAILKIIGITILVMLGIIILFAICFVGRNIWNAFAFMLGYIGATLKNIIFGGLFILILIWIISGLFS